MPPAALMSATACSTPFLIWRPKTASDPVVGLATPSLSLGGPLSPHPARASTAAQTKAANDARFIASLALKRRRLDRPVLSNALNSGLCASDLLAGLGAPP